MGTPAGVGKSKLVKDKFGLNSPLLKEGWQAKPDGVLSFI